MVSAKPLQDCGRKVREVFCCTGIPLGIPTTAEIGYEQPLSCCPTGIHRISADPLCEQKSHVSPHSRFTLKTPVRGAPAPQISLGFITRVSADSFNASARVHQANQQRSAESICAEVVVFPQMSGPS